MKHRLSIRLNAKLRHSRYYTEFAITVIEENSMFPRRIGSLLQKCKRSYSKKAFPWDNACIESFHALIKQEWLNRLKIRYYRQTYCLIFEYIEVFYNINGFIAIAIACHQRALKNYMSRYRQRGCF